MKWIQGVYKAKGCGDWDDESCGERELRICENGKIPKSKQ
jgi:hypothetical protein